MSAKTLAATHEAISEAAYQLATCQEEQKPDGAAAALSILRAIANTADKQTRAFMIEELSGYLIPFCALEIGSSEEGARL